MSLDYDRTQPHQFGGVLPEARSFEQSKAVILPVPFDRTTSYGQGTKHGPRELLLASAQVELWDEEMGVDVHPHGMFTAPELDLSSRTLDDAVAEIGRVTGGILDAGKFLITLGGEHSITSPIVEAVAKRHKGVTVLQVDAHADLRDSYLEEPHSHACAMRRTLSHARVVQVGIRNVSEEEARAIPGLPTTIFYDWNMHHDRSRRSGAGLDAGGRDAGTGRIVVAGTDDAPPPHF